MKIRARDPEKIGQWLRTGQYPGCIVVLGGSRPTYKFATRLRAYLEEAFGPIDYVEVTNGGQIYTDHVKGRQVVLVGDESARTRHMKRLYQLSKGGKVKGIIWALEPGKGTRIARDDDAYITDFGRIVGDKILSDLGKGNPLLITPIKSGGVPFGMALNEHLRRLARGLDIGYFELADPKTNNIGDQLKVTQTRGRIVVAVDDGIYTSTTIREFARQVEDLREDLKIPDWFYAVKYDRTGLADFAETIKTGVKKVPREELLRHLSA